MNEEEQAPPPQEAASASPSPDPSEGVAAPEISRRVGSILDAVEREAARLREEARGEASRLPRQRAPPRRRPRRRAAAPDLRAQRRAGRKSEAVIARLDDAAPVRQGFENLVRALGDAAERLAHEAEGTAHDFDPPAFGTTPAMPPGVHPAQAAQPPQPAGSLRARPALRLPRPARRLRAWDPGRYADGPVTRWTPPRPSSISPSRRRRRPPYPQPYPQSYPHPSRTQAAPGWSGGEGHGQAPAAPRTRAGASRTRRGWSRFRWPPRAPPAAPSGSTCTGLSGSRTRVSCSTRSSARQR